MYGNNNPKPGYVIAGIALGVLSVGLLAYPLMGAILTADKCYRLGHAGRYQEAIPACRAEVERMPNSAAAHNNLGYYLTLSGDPQAGLIECQKAVDLDPSSLSCLDSLALAEALTGNATEALKNSTRSIVDPDKYPGREATYGAALYANGRHDEARTAWQHVVSSGDESAARIARSFLSKYP